MPRITWPCRGWIPNCRDPGKFALTKAAIVRECKECGVCRGIVVKPVKAVMTIPKQP